jgi:hypothetical protein
MATPTGCILPRRRTRLTYSRGLCVKVPCRFLAAHRFVRSRIPDVAIVAIARLFPTHITRKRGDTYVDRFRSLARHRLRKPGHRLRPRGRGLDHGPVRRFRTDAGNRRRHSGRRPGLSQSAVHHHRYGGRRTLRRSLVIPRHGHGGRFRRRRHPLGSGGLYRHECVGARQCPHRAGGDRQSRIGAGRRLPRWCRDRHAGGRSGSDRRGRLLYVSGRR